MGNVSIMPVPRPVNVKGKKVKEILQTYDLPTLTDDQINNLANEYGLSADEINNYVSFITNQIKTHAGMGATDKSDAYNKLVGKYENIATNFKSMEDYVNSVVDNVYKKGLEGYALLKTGKDSDGNSLISMAPTEDELKDYFDILENSGLAGSNLKSRYKRKGYPDEEFIKGQYFVDQALLNDPTISEDVKFSILNNLSKFGGKFEDYNIILGDMNLATPEKTDKFLKDYVQILANQPAEAFDVEGTPDLRNIILDKLREGMEVTDIDQIINDIIMEGESPYVDETKYTDDTTDDTTDTTTQTSREEVQDILDSLGISAMFDDAEREDALNYFSNLIDEGTASPYEIRALLQQSPEYQKVQQEQERAAIQQEATETRRALGTELEKGTGRFLETTLAPALRREFSQLGGKDRASLEAASSRALRDIGQERESTLAQAGLEQAARQEGYQREDYISQMVNQYNQAMSKWNQAYTKQAEARQQEIQKYWYPIQQAGIRQQQAYQSKEADLNRDWQTYMANLQRGWDEDDWARGESLAKRQNWYNLLGTGIGAGIGGWAGK